MNINLAKILTRPPFLVAALALLMTGLGSGAIAAKEDTQAKRKNQADQASRSWFETLSWEERGELLYNLQSDPLGEACQKEKIIKVYNQESELVTEFIMNEETPILDKDLRILIYRSDYLMSIENEIYYMLFE